MSATRLEILRYPDPRLSVPCEEVDLSRIGELDGLIEDMIYTMFYSEGIGLAAPQVGHGIRLFIVDPRPINGNPNMDPWVFINPKIEVISNKRVLMREGCLSFPGVYVSSKRHEQVRITAHDRKGNEFSMETAGNALFSQAVQHENDHLDGVLMSSYADKRGKRAIQSWVGAIEDGS